MKTAPWIIITVLIVVIFLQRECSHVPDQPPANDTIAQTSDTAIGEPVIITDTFYIPIPSDTVFIDTGSTHFILREVDSSAIVADYLLKFFYPDTLANDSNIFVAVYDSVARNRIVYRRPDIRYSPTIITNTNTITQNAEPVRKLYAGVGVGRSPEQFGLSANLMYVSKRDNAYSLSYDLLNQDIYFTMFWKIKLRNAKSSTK